MTINPHVKRDNYPLPKFEDLVAKLSGGRYFSKIDLRDAYIQLEVDPDYRKFLVIVTHKGYKQLPFGVNSAPSLFQRIMDQLLSGITGTVSYLNDIYVTASTKNLLLERLRQILDKLYNTGMKMQKSKCCFSRKK